MFNFMKKLFKNDNTTHLLDALRTNHQIIANECKNMQSALNALKIENEALKEEVNNLKQVIDTQDINIDNMTFERMGVMKAYDRFHRDLMAVYGDDFPIFPQENDLTEPISGV